MLSYTNKSNLLGCLLSTSKSERAKMLVRSNSHHTTVGDCRAQRETTFYCAFSGHGLGFRRISADFEGVVPKIKKVTTSDSWGVARNIKCHGPGAHAGAEKTVFR